MVQGDLYREETDAVIRCSAHYLLSTFFNHTSRAGEDY